MKCHALPIQNLVMTNVMEKIQRIKAHFKTWGTVTSVLYRKWRTRQRTRSTDTAAINRKEAPDVAQPDRNCTFFKLQNAVNFSSSSAILTATKSGWHINPTRRSEAAKQPKRTKDGDWRSGVFATAKIKRTFAIHVARENIMLTIHKTIFAMKILLRRRIWARRFQSRHRFCLNCSWPE